ncbi:hypothetical protein BHM03_00000308 [Ensete ventricosum]|uniref:Uncharacterized protein n=1 Tax=Ensete ventricosum TaxID=4639 RepID=A0A445M8C2_ENSVE|nr:hypothetical protein BHM03_00000308 [Ensete ventricosum]
MSLLLFTASEVSASLSDSDLDPDPESGSITSTDARKLNLNCLISTCPRRPLLRLHRRLRVSPWRRGRRAAVEGGVREGRAEEPEARAAAPQEEVKRIQSVSLVIGIPEQRHRRIHHRLQLLRPDPQHHRPRAPQTIDLRRPPMPFVDVLPPEAESSISLLNQSEKPLCLD